MMKDMNIVKMAIVKIALLTGAALFALGGGILFVSFAQKHAIDQKTQADQQDFKTQKISYLVSQIQQFLTDASLTRDRSAVSEAEKNFDDLNKEIANLSEIAPEHSDDLKMFKSKAAEFQAVGLEMVKAYTEKDLQAGNEIMKRKGSGFDDQSEALQKIMTGFASQIQKKSEDLSLQIRQLQLWTIWIVLGLSALTMVFLIFGIRRLLRVALMHLAEETSQRSKTVLHSADEISNLSQTLSTSVSQAAATVKQTESSLDQIASNFKVCNEKLHTTKDLSEETTRLGANGVCTLEQLTVVMSEIKTKSESISEIILLIDEIAFQTNLLALNASVEAARAGESGRGFSVVADAVRALAQRSANAANDIKKLINSSRDSVQMGVKLSDEMKSEVSRMVEALEIIMNQSDDIYTSSLEQEAALTVIQGSMKEIDHATQNNAHSSESLMGAATNAVSEAHQLEEVVDKIRESFAA